MHITPISYDDTTRLKGMAILLIVLHNFFHALPGASLENEFLFDINNTYYYFQSIIHSFRTPDILKLFTEFFSFFGHYGVALFIFLSGYGLASKYASSGFSFSGKMYFIWKRILRFWKVIIPLIPVSIVIKTLKSGNGLWDTISNYAGEYLSILTFTQTIIPGKEFIVSGPWWFFAAILQLYILYIFLLHQKSNRFLLVIGLTAVLLQGVALFFGWEDFLFRLRYNFIGWVPVFCLGIYCAGKPDISFSPVMAAILMAIFLLSNSNAYLWLFSSIMFPLAFIPLFRNIPVKSLWKFTGGLSFYIFAIHSFVRGGFFVLVSKDEIVEDGLELQVCALYLIVCILAAYILRMVLNYCSKLFDSYKYRLKKNRLCDEDMY